MFSIAFFSSPCMYLQALFAVGKNQAIAKQCHLSHAAEPTRKSRRARAAHASRSADRALDGFSIHY